jgi:phosphonate transport system permease protein
VIGAGGKTKTAGAVTATAGHDAADLHILRPRWQTRAGWLLLAIYVVYAASQLDASWERVAAGLHNAGHFLGRMFPPNFSRWELLVKGLQESLEIAVLASTLGIVLALPVGLLAARNLMPAWVSWPARMIVVAARSFHPVIVAILFVKAVGFGALAGILALAVASIGFVGKLFAEAIEEISLKPLEAVRAAGAPFASVIAFAVLPQVLSRFIGFCTYQLDSNLRNSTMVGIVGAGGIGGTLFAAFQRFDYDYVCAILISIIALIMVGELIATAVRAIFIDGRSLAELIGTRRGQPALAPTPLAPALLTDD